MELRILQQNENKIADLFKPLIGKRNTILLLQGNICKEFYFNKSKTANGIDSIVFAKGFKMTDNSLGVINIL